MNIVLFKLSSSGIAEDISKRKPIKVIGNPRRKHYTLKSIEDELYEMHEHSIRLISRAIADGVMPGIRERTYQRLLNRRAALRYAKLLKMLEP